MGISCLICNYSNISVFFGLQSSLGPLKFNVLKQPFKCVKFLVNPINLKTIQDKVECVPSAYRSLIEFRADFQHIVHNCTITYTGMLIVRDTTSAARWHSKSHFFAIFLVHIKRCQKICVFNTTSWCHAKKYYECHSKV